MADTKITRLRNLLTPMKNYIAMVNADKRGESISTLLLDRELETINKYSDEIWAIIAEIPNNACDSIKAKPEDTKALPLHSVSQRSKLLFTMFNLAQTMPDNLTEADKMKVVNKFIVNNCG